MGVKIPVGVFTCGGEDTLARGEVTQGGGQETPGNFDHRG